MVSYEGLCACCIEVFACRYSFMLELVLLFSVCSVRIDSLGEITMKCITYVNAFVKKNDSKNYGSIIV